MQGKCSTFSNRIVNEEKTFAALKLFQFHLFPTAALSCFCAMIKKKATLFSRVIPSRIPLLIWSRNNSRPFNPVVIRGLPRFLTAAGGILSCHMIMEGFCVPFAHGNKKEGSLHLSAVSSPLFCSHPLGL